jgi:hypothetical protein
MTRRLFEPDILMALDIPDWGSLSSSQHPSFLASSFLIYSSMSAKKNLPSENVSNPKERRKQKVVAARTINVQEQPLASGSGSGSVGGQGAVSFAGM